jgi:hypothetical protein
MYDTYSRQDKELIKKTIKKTLPQTLDVHSSLEHIYWIRWGSQDQLEKIKIFLKASIIKLIQCIIHGKYMLSKKGSIKKMHHEQMILLILNFQVQACSSSIQVQAS